MNERQSWQRTTPTMERRPQRGPVVREIPDPVVHEEDKSDRRAHGIRDIISGLVLIGIGLAFGGSVFTGDPTALDWFFDILGSFWVAKGVYQLVT